MTFAMKKHLGLIISFLMTISLMCSCSSGEKNAKQGFPAFEDAKVGVLVGTSYESYLSKNYPNLNKYCMDNNADLFMSLDQGKIDIFMYDVLSFVLDDTRSKEKYMIVKDSLVIDHMGVAFPKNSELCGKFNEFLAEIKSNGTWQQIYDNWLVPNGPNKMPDLSNIQRSGKPLRVACSGAYAYFDMIVDGQNAGFDPEMMQRFAAWLGRPVEFQTMNFSSLIPSITSNKCDLAASSISITEERSKMVDFSDEYVSSRGAGLALRARVEGNGEAVAAQENPADYYPILKDKKVGVLVGSTHEKYITSLMGNDIKLSCYDAVPDMYLALDQGKIDYGVDDGLLFTLTNSKGNHYEVIIDTLRSETLGFTFNKQQTALRDSFNSFLADIKKDGQYQKIHDNWLSPDGANTMPDFSDIPRSGAPIRVSCNGSVHYFDMIANGKHAGIDIEIIETFAASIKRPVEYYTASFAGTLTSVITGKTDMGCGGVTITEERAKSLDFSDTYVVSYSTVFKKRGKSEATIYGSMDDLDHGIIGVMTGSAQDINATKDFPEATLMRAEHPALISALKAHKCDCILLPYIQGMEVIRQNPSLCFVNQKLYNAELGIAFNINNTELRDKFNEFLKTVKGNGLYDSLSQKYLLNNAGPDSIDEKFDRGDPSLPKLRVCTDGTTYPYNFQKNGILIGFDIELSIAFAKYIGRYASFDMTPFETIIPAISVGKEDMAASMIMITAERRKAVSFSDPYDYGYTAIIIRKENQAGQDITSAGEKKVPFFTKLKHAFTNNLIAEKRYKLILSGLWNTILISIFSALLGTLLGAGVCALRMAKSKLLSGTAKVYIDIMRGTPILVFLMIVFYVIFAKVNISAVIVSIIAFAMNFAAYASEMFRTAIEGIDRGQSEAGSAMGFTKLSTFKFIVLPQAVKRVMPVYKGELISLLKTTSIVGYIAVQDLTKASDIIRSRTFDAFFPLIVITIIYFILAWLLGKALDMLNSKVNKRK